VYNQGLADIVDRWLKVLQPELPQTLRWALDVVYNQGLTDIVDRWLIKSLGVQGLEAIKQRYRRERT
jgi:hypothetical protein